MRAAIGQADARAVVQRVQVAEHTLRRHSVPPHPHTHLININQVLYIYQAFSPTLSLSRARSLSPFLSLPPSLSRARAHAHALARSLALSTYIYTHLHTRARTCAQSIHQSILQGMPVGALLEAGAAEQTATSAGSWRQCRSPLWSDQVCKPAIGAQESDTFSTGGGGSGQLGCCVLQHQRVPVQTPAMSGLLDEQPSS